MSKVRCSPCSGSGKIMGGGMIFNDCEYCDGIGKIPVSTGEKNPIEIDKRSKHYKSAIKRIKALNETISDEEAEKIFYEEFKKIEN